MKEPSVAARDAGRRRGVSLLEVLISIFVLSIGLLGIAAMIPIGGSEIDKANQADRSAVLGRAALREVKVRRMLENWQSSLDNPSVEIQTWMPQGGWSLNTPQYVMIDPLMAANGVNAFPNATASYTMARVNLRRAPYSTALALTPPGAETIFVSHDDLNFDTSEKDRRPLAIPSSSGTSQQYEGNYSWMAMVAPAERDVHQWLQAGSGGVFRASRVTVSAIVFYKRNLVAAQAERVANVTDAYGLGLGGGDVRLTAGNVDDFKGLRRNHWILLCGQTGNMSWPNVFKWYRVVAVGQDNPNSASRDVTLAGSDWLWSTTNVQAVLIEGVVGVYTETVELNDDLLRVP